MAKNVQTFFAPSGPLALAFAGYQPRASQVEMSLMIEKLFKTTGFNCIEAETGIGKSFAYLVPALFKATQDKQKIVISTHTIALQEQLFYKDLPFLVDLLGLEIEIVLVKGMGNYLCLEKLDRLKADPAYFKNPHLTELNTEQETASHNLPKELWSKLSADALSCLAHTCPHYKECHFFKARKPLEVASILIVNHHLLLTDLMLKSGGKETAILPPSHHLIIDEAHHAPLIAEELFAFGLTHNSLEPRLKPKILKEHLSKLAKAFKKIHEEKLHFFCSAESLEMIDDLLQILQHCFELVSSDLPPSSNYLLLDIPRQDLKELFSEASFKLGNLQSSLEHLLKIAKETEVSEKYRSSLFVIEKLKNECQNFLDTLKAFEEIKSDKLFFFERTSHNSSFQCHYIHASQKLAPLLQSYYLSTTFCSATLTFDLCFENFKKECGLLGDKYTVFEGRFFSDFDYKQAMLFAIPSDIPEPTHPDYETKLYSFCYEIIKTTSGGVFILFTSYDLLNKIANRLQKSDLSAAIKLYIQGTDSKQNLLDGFKSGLCNVLLGTDSFWEGVDVQGEKLRCVILTKLPFRSPHDPIFQATATKLKEEKKDPFFEKALPEACTKFKQGLGRLIRSKQDYGVVICTDMRLINKNYGKYFLKMLPNCQKKLAPTSEILKAVGEKMLLLKRTRVMLVNQVSCDVVTEPFIGR